MNAFSPLVASIEIGAGSADFGLGRGRETGKRTASGPRGAVPEDDLPMPRLSMPWRKGFFSI
ncbi:MAG: hypothetical protein ACLQKY_07085 [Terracidiphilus sp.]